MILVQGISPFNFKSKKGYVITTVKRTCKCKDCQPDWARSQMFCKKCGATFKTSLFVESIFDSVDDLRDHLPETKQESILRNSNDALKFQLERADDQIKKQTVRIAELEKRLEEATAVRDAYGERCEVFERDLKEKARKLDEASVQIDTISSRCRELEGKLSESEGKLENIETGYKSEVERLLTLLSDERKEKESFKTEHESLMDTIRHLDQEVKDLRDTNNHSRLEVERMRSLNVRNIVSYVMVYAAAVNNAVNDGIELADIRALVDARTNKLIMDLASQGITVTRHRSGDLLKDGRMDVSNIITDIPEKDMRVVRSNSYGSLFRNDLYPEIPESVVVYRYNIQEVQYPDSV